MSRALRSLPSNVTDTVRVLARLDGRLLNVEASRALTAEPFEDALPIRDNDELAPETGKTLEVRL